MFREINTNKSSYTLFTILNFSFILFAYLIVFYIISEISPAIEVVNDFTDSYLYSYNIDLSKYYDEDDYKYCDLYAFDYIPDNGQSKYILYLNSNASKNGIIYISDIAFLKIDLSSLEKNKIYSNNKDSEFEYIDIKQYNTIKTKFVNMNLHYDLICVSDDYFLENEPIVIVYKSITNIIGLNNISDDNYVATGKYLKSSYKNAFESNKNMFILFTLLPIMFSILSLINIINLFIRKEKDNITIKLVYYASRRKIGLSYSFKLGLFIIFSDTIAILLSSLIFNQLSVKSVIFAILLSSFFEIICCYLIVSVNVKLLEKKMDFGEELC